MGKNKIREQIVNELHKPAQKKFIRKPVKILGIDDLWQTDLTILDAFSKVNSGYKYLLVVIDCFSKFAWVKKLKTKSGPEVAREFRAIFNESGRSCKNLQADKGTEFYNPHFKKVMKEFNVNFYSTYTHIKASIVERLQRTLKEKLWKKFTLNGNHIWINIIDDLVKEYNRTKHTTIKLEPYKVNKKNEKYILKNIYLKREQKLQKLARNRSPKFKVNDFVRISKFKKTFEKGFTKNYTPEIFKIIAVNKKFPFTYLLEDYQKRPIMGRFYEKELLQVK
jgi:hypothetical protein